jgi:hypothetical protein
VINASYASVDTLVVSHSTYPNSGGNKEKDIWKFSTNICALPVVEREMAQENRILETKNELKRRKHTSA